MTDTFNVAIEAQDYPPEVIRRLARLLNTDPAKLALHLQHKDLMVKKNVDETTAQRYAALIYQRTGAETLVTGGPDLSSVTPHSKPPATKVATASNSASKTPLRLAGAAIALLICISLGYLGTRPDPEDSLTSLELAIANSDAARLSQYLATERFLKALYSELSQLPEAHPYFPGAGQQMWLAKQQNHIRNLFEQAGAKTGPDGHLFRRLAHTLDLAALSASDFTVEREGDSATATATIQREDLSSSFPLELTLHRSDAGWQVVEWRNAKATLNRVYEAEQARLTSVNREITQALAAVLDHFTYEEQVTGVHRFSMGQLLIQAQLVNQHHVSLRAAEGEIFVYGVTSQRRYATKPFSWEAQNRLIPPGGKLNIEVFFSLDGPYPDLVDALEQQPEKLEIGYQVFEVEFRDGKRLKTYPDYETLQATESAE